MEKKFIYNLEKLCPNYINAKFLLAVSGGIDSMVMMKLFEEKGLYFSVAHCNFHLRGDESDRDEKFVKEEVEKIEKKIHIIHFDTNKYSSENKIGTEEAARELRYNWFSELATTYGYEYIAVAHNKNDLAETFIINLNRGSGLNGLASIPEKNGKIIRPLLDFSRADIRTFAKRKNVKNIEDSTNATNNYLRNSIRNSLLPAADLIMPGFTNRVAESAKHLKLYKKIIDAEIEKKLSQYNITTDNNITEFQTDEIRHDEYFELIILKLLQDNKFPAKILSQIVSCVNTNDAKQFHTKEKTIIIHRGKFTIKKQNISENSPILIEKDYKNIDIKEIEYITTKIIKGKSDIIKDKKYIQLNIDKLTFPLTIRTWETGDKIKPFGMRGYKNVSKYLSDLKLHITEKESIKVICSNKKIAAIIGYCICEDFAINSFPCEILEIKLR